MLTAKHRKMFAREVLYHGIVTGGYCHVSAEPKAVATGHVPESQPFPELRSIHARRLSAADNPGFALKTRTRRRFSTRKPGRLKLNPCKAAVALFRSGPRSRPPTMRGWLRCPAHVFHGLTGSSRCGAAAPRRRRRAAGPARRHRSSAARAVSRSARPHYIRARWPSA